MFWQLQGVRKRNVIVTLLAILVTFLLAWAVVWRAFYQERNVSIPSFTLDDFTSTTTCLGAGVNLTQIDATNAVRNGEFEPMGKRYVLPIVEGGKGMAQISLADLPLNLLQNKNALAQLSFEALGQNKNSFNSLFVEAQATEISYVAQVPQPLNLPKQYAKDFVVAAVWRDQTQAVIVSKTGTVVVQKGSEIQVKQIENKPDIIGFVKVGSEVLICATDGSVYGADLAGMWNRVASLSNSSNISRVVAATYKGQDRLVGVGAKGFLAYYDNGEWRPIEKFSSDDLVEIVSHQGKVYVFTSQGKIFVTNRLGEFSELIVPNKVPWQRVTSYGEEMLLQTTGNKVARWDGKSTSAIEMFSVAQIQEAIVKAHGLTDTPIALSPDIQSAVITPNGAVIAVNADGTLLQNQNNVWSVVAEQPKMRQVISMGKQGVLYQTQDGAIQVVDYNLQFNWNAAVTDEVLKAGDLLQFSQTSHLDSLSAPERIVDKAAAVNLGEWWGYRSDIAIESSVVKKTTTNALKVGFGNETATWTGLLSKITEPAAAAESLTYFDNSETTSIVRQYLEPTFFTNPDSGALYRLSLRLKASGLRNNELIVAVRGATMPITLVIRNVGESWRDEVLSFVLPSSWIRNGQPLSLDFAMQGKGTVWLDAIKLENSSNHAFLPSSNLRERTVIPVNGMLRLGGIPIGAMDLGKDIYFAEAGNASVTSNLTMTTTSNLTKGLSLALEKDANPVLPIEVGVQSDELAHLTDYLAQPPATSYGELRAKQGILAPCVDIFKNIYLEIGDPRQILNDDHTRASYVNWVIDTIKTSPYYAKLRSKILFVDAMNYENGIKLSSADYKSARVGTPWYQYETSAKGLDNRIKAIEKGTHDYLISAPRVFGEQTARPLWAYFGTPKEALPLAERTAEAYELLGKGVGTFMLELRQEDKSVATVARQTALLHSIVPSPGDELINAEKMPVLQLAKLDSDGKLETTDESNALLTKSIRMYASRNGRRTKIVIVNMNHKPYSVRLKGEKTANIVSAVTFDSDGAQLLSRNKMTVDPLVSLPTGGVVVILIDDADLAK